MNAEQQFERIAVESLLDRVHGFRAQGYRLVQIGATNLGEQLELNYTFDRERQMTNLRLHVPAIGGRLPSISSIYWCAFIYENEMHDLFNVAVSDMAVDFQGKFYNTAVKYAFGSTKPPVGKSAPAASTPLPAAATAAAGVKTEGVTAGVS